MIASSLASLLGTAACIGNDDSQTTTNAQQGAMCPSPDLLDHAICVCDDLQLSGALTVATGAGGNGSVGVNGASTLSGAAIAGQLVAGGDVDISGNGEFGSLVSNGNASISGSVSVAGNVQIAQDANVSGAFRVGGSLAIGGAENSSGAIDAPRREQFGNLAAAPCGCAPDQLFDVAGAVQAAAAQLGGQESWEAAGDYTVTLPTGSYYLTQATLAGASAIHIAGNVSLFVDGDVNLAGASHWDLDDTASLDLFVSGDANIAGLFEAGATRPNALRVFIGGTGTSSLNISGAATFAGSIYAPRATVALSGTTKIAGALFAKSLDASGDLTVVHDTNNTAPTSCEAPPSPSQDPVIVE